MLSHVRRHPHADPDSASDIDVATTATAAAGDVDPYVLWVTTSPVTWNYEDEDAEPAGAVITPA